MIGLGLVLLGLKLRHRPEQEARSLEDDFEEDHEEAGYDDLIKEIAALYDAHDAGEVEEEQFILRRQALLIEIKIAKAKLENTP